MNKDLQYILDFIKNSEHLTEKEKADLTKTVRDADKELEITAFKLERTEKVKKTTAILLEETIEELEQKRKAVEAQNRELEIEASLERVRAQAMGMNKPDDILNICEILFKEFISLGFSELRNSMINIHNDEKKSFLNYDYSDEIGKSITPLNYNTHPVMEKQINQSRAANDAFSEAVYKGNDLEEWKEFRRKYGEKDDPRIKNINALYYYFYSIGNGTIGISTFNPINEEKLALLKKFRNVFSLSYQRYSDIVLAESQAREAQIELALERVRARTMGMQKSEELKEVIPLVYEQFVHLKINVDHTGFVVDYTPKGDWHFWIADKHEVPSKITHTYFDSVWANQFNRAKEEGLDFFATNLNFEEKNKFYQDLFELIPGVPEETLEFYFNCPGLAGSTILLDNVGLYIENFSGIPYTDEENAVLMRFGKVFQQTYTRFLDLKKAEAQAREAQIEAALEKVRSRSLAMHTSKDLELVITILLQQLEEVGILLDTASIVIPSKDKKTSVDWTASKKYKYSKGFIVPFMENGKPALSGEINRDIVTALKSGKEFTKSYSKKEKNKYYQNLFDKSGFSETPEGRKEFLLSLPGISVSTAGSKNSYIQIFSYSGEELSAADLAVLKRFAMVFEQCYIRFLDLQKAEAQAREAQIETALEKVRSRTMGMQHSDELADASFLLDSQVRALGIKTRGCAFNIYGDNESTEWFSSEMGTMPMYKTPRENIFLRYYEEGKKGKSIYIESFTGDACAAHYDYLCTLPVMGEALKEFKESGGSFPTQQIDHVTYFKYGYLLFITLEPVPDAHDIFLRFAKVFEQTYTRFLDLQKSEAQAREAQIEAELERVRARTMAMQKSEDMGNTASEMFKQIQSLGMVPWGCGFNIFDKDEKAVAQYMSLADGGISPPFRTPLTEDPFFINIYNARQSRDELLVWESKGESLAETYRYMFGLPGSREIFGDLVNSGFEMPKFQITHCAYFSQGYLVFITYEHVPEAHDIFKRFAKVFEQTYTRFLDLQKSEVQAREAEIQLGT